MDDEPMRRARWRWSPVPVVAVPGGRLPYASQDSTVVVSGIDASGDLHG
jgi:hypothetical protein